MTGGRDIIGSALVYQGVTIRDRGEMLSLTDMWKAAGSPEGKRPNDWAALPQSQGFMEAVAASSNTGKSGIWISKRGNNGGTFAHWQIGLAYAKYLAHEFHMWCNEVVRAHMESGAAAPAGRVTDLAADVRAAIGGIVKGIVHREVAELIPALVRAELAERNLIVRSGRTAKQIWDAAALPPRLRGSTVWFGNRLAEMSCLAGGGLRADRGAGSIRLFDPDKADICLRNGLRERAERYAAERKGQGNLFRIVPTP